MGDRLKDRSWEHLRGDPKWLGDDRWKATIHVGIDPVTRRDIQRTRNFRAKGISAARKEQARLQGLMRDELVAARSDEGTVADLIKRWLKLKRQKWEDSTYYNAERMLQQVRREFGRLPVTELDAMKLDDWYGRLLDAGASRGWVAHYHRLIFGMLKQAHKWKMVPGNEAELASPPPRQTRADTHDTPAPAVVMALMAAANPDLRLAARIASTNGLRRGEVAGLRWSDFNGGVMHVQRAMVKVPGMPAGYKPTKSGDHRVLDLDPDTVGMLLDHRMAQLGNFARLGLPFPTDCPLFLNWRGPRAPQERRPDWFSKEWRDLCESQGVNHRLHSLRHFTATHLIDQGHSLAEVAGVLGHATPAITAKVYTHRTSASSPEVAKTMGKLLALPPGQSGVAVGHPFADGEGHR